VLREKGLLVVRRGPFGEQLETFASQAFAVCDHQVAHVYIKDSEAVPKVRDTLMAITGVGRVLVGDERSSIGLNHPRSGEIVVLSKPDAWFAYPFWLDDRLAPDYARAVAIHHKPGYDPCELLLDPRIMFPKLKVIGKLIRKKLGFRMIMDVVPLDASLIRGTHGIPSADVEDGPLLIGAGPRPQGSTLPMTVVRDLLLEALSRD
jgi:hypothetical protein